MKYEIVGGAFSRQHRVTGFVYDDMDEVVALYKEVSSDNLEHLDWIDRARALGTRYLESVGLPTDLMLHQLDPGGEWKPGPSDRDDYVEARSLDRHIQALGHKRDSLPDLAARLILQAQNTEDTESGIDPGRSEQMLRSQYAELGRLIGIWGAYLKVADGRAMRGKSKRRVWADAVAEKIREQYPEKTKDQLWEAIGDLGVITAGGEQWECYRDGKCLIAIRDYDGSEHKLAESGFKKRYLKGR